MSARDRGRAGLLVLAIVFALRLAAAAPPIEEIRQAVRRGDVQRVKSLLAEHAASLAGSDAGLLHEAAAAGQVEIIAALLGAGADVNGRDKRGLTPLHHAARHGREAAAARVAGVLGFGGGQVAVGVELVGQRMLLCLHAVRAGAPGLLGVGLNGVLNLVRHVSAPAEEKGRTGTPAASGAASW